MGCSKTPCCCCGFTCGDGEQVGAGKQAAHGQSQKGFSPSCHILPQTLVWNKLTPGQHLVGLVPPFCLCPSLILMWEPCAALGKPGSSNEVHLTHKQHLPFFLDSFSSASCGNPTFPQAKLHCQAGKLGVIPEALNPVVLTSPSSSMTGEAPPGVETLLGEDGSDLEVYNKECFGTRWQILWWNARAVYTEEKILDTVPHSRLIIMSWMQESRSK